MINRETIYQALFDKLSTVSNFQTKSRRLKHWDDMSRPDMPAFFMSQKIETPEQEKKLPTKWRLSVDVVIYVHTGGDHSVTPSSLINPILDALELKLKPNPITGYTTLDIPGVSHCWMSGAVEYDEGVLGDFGVAIVPLEILAI